VWRLDCQGKNIIGRYWGKNKHSWHRRVLDVFWKEKGERAGGLVIGYVVGEVTREDFHIYYQWNVSKTEGSGLVRLTFLKSSL
jgi:hypothetical protein